MCKIHVLDLVEETVRRCYSDIDTLIASTKFVFLKSPKRVGDYHRLFPDIPKPPQPILTHWVFDKHFENITNVVLQFNLKEPAAIQENQ